MVYYLCTFVCGCLTEGLPIHPPPSHAACTPVWLCDLQIVYVPPSYTLCTPVWMCDLQIVYPLAMLSVPLYGCVTYRLRTP